MLGTENQSRLPDSKLLCPGAFAGGSGGFGFVTGWLMRCTFSSA
jgi:hypothetical protein